MDLLAALDIIRNAPDESLHIHATQTISTLKVIEKRLQRFLLPSSPIVVDTPASVESARSQSPTNSEVSYSPYNHCLSHSECPTIPTSRNHHPASSTPSVSQQGAPEAGIPSTTAPLNHRATRSSLEPLLDGIKKHACWLLDAEKLNDDAIISYNQSLGDIRLEDIRRVDGVKVRDRESKVRRVLALRSLAQEHDNDQKQNGISPTRLEELCSYVSCPKTSTLNLKANNTVKERFKTRALHSGLRHLTIERTLNARLNERDLPGNCEAISAVLALNIDLFRCLRYDEFAAVLDAVQSMRIPIKNGKRKRGRKTTEEKTTPLLPLLRDLNQWFARLQKKYEVYVSQSVVIDSGKRKRPCPDQGSFEQCRASFTHTETRDREDYPTQSRMNTRSGGVEEIIYGFYHSGMNNDTQPPPGTVNTEESQPVTDNAGIPPDLFDEILAQPVNICALSPDIFTIDDISSRDARHVPFPTHWE